MNIHPMILDYLSQPHVPFVITEPVTIDVEKWKENINKADEYLAKMTLEQYEKCRVEAHHYLFGRVIENLH